MQHLIALSQHHSMILQSVKTERQWWAPGGQGELSNKKATAQTQNHLNNAAQAWAFGEVWNRDLTFAHVLSTDVSLVITVDEIFYAGVQSLHLVLQLITHT